MLVKKTFQPLLLSAVCEIYSLLHESGSVSFSLTSDAEGRIDSVVANVTGTHFGHEAYPDPREKQ